MRERSRRTDQDDHEHAQPGRSRTGPQRAGGSSLSDHVLGLQRDYGNAAVTTVVQRKERPQSTDAPWVKKAPKPKPSKVPPTPAVEDFRPKAGSKEYTTTLWPDDRIKGWIQDHGASATGASAKSIARMWDELYWRKPDWMMGLNIYRAWSKVKGEEKRAKFWLDWFNSKGKLLDPKPESMAGKEF